VRVDSFPLELATISATDQIARDSRCFVSAATTERFSGDTEISSASSDIKQTPMYRPTRHDNKQIARARVQSILRTIFGNENH